RKRLFPLKDELKYVGTIPPLRTPHHPLKQKLKDLKVGTYREGAVVGMADEGVKVDIGMEGLAVLHMCDKIRKNDRLTLKITSISPLEVEVADREDIPFYWGYVTKTTGRLGKTISRFSDEKIVLTSRLGEIVSVDKMQEILSERVLFVFGPPNRSVEEILREENLSTEDFSSTALNTIPSQNTATVRTEEAIFATLSVYNSFRAL
ncbi:MAG: putative RNA uridine N3 methyltransferase, partial [Halobacteriota archaeon]|nr:putative RNA uridine N3 methyltransferase [Halobacteriota archaeon]